MVKALSQVTQGYDVDSEAKRLVECLAAGTVYINSRNPTVQGKNLAWLGNNQTLQLSVISALHDSVVGVGTPVFLSRIVGSKRCLRG